MGYSLALLQEWQPFIAVFQGSILYANAWFLGCVLCGVLGLFPWLVVDSALVVGFCHLVSLVDFA